MSDRKRYILEAAQRMDYFNTANPQLAIEMPSIVESFARNHTNIERLHDAGITSASSGSAKTSGTRSKVARSAEITVNLRRTANTAKRIARKTPAFKNNFIIPRGSLTYQEIIEIADSFVAAAPAAQVLFDKLALKKEFFDELATDVDEFREAAHDQADAHRSGVGATADTEAILEDTLDAREELDIAVRNHFRSDPVKLAEWLTASHIETKKKNTEKPPTAETPPTDEEPSKP